MRIAAFETLDGRKRSSRLEPPAGWRCSLVIVAGFPAVDVLGTAGSAELCMVRCLERLLAGRSSELDEDSASSFALLGEWEKYDRSDILR